MTTPEPQAGSYCFGPFRLDTASRVLARDGTIVPLAPRTFDLLPKPPHFAPKARRVVPLFMNGGPSQVDTFDPKPALDRFHGQPLPLNNLRTERKTGAAMKSPFTFKRHGQSGIEVSELFQKTAAHIDSMAHLREEVAFE